jgi:hypothetical protein
MGLRDLPTECTAVLNSGGGAPVVAADGTVPAALKVEADKDAGPPIPKLDPVAYAALKAEFAKKGKSKPGAKAEPASAAASVPTTPASTVGPASPDDPAVDNPSDDPISANDAAVPLPDRKPQ